jgi:hypothetical protein
MQFLQAKIERITVCGGTCVALVSIAAVILIASNTLRGDDHQQHTQAVARRRLAEAQTI